MFIKETKGKLRFIDSDSDTVVKRLDNKLYELEANQTMFGTNYFFNENSAYDKGKVAEAGVFKNIKEYVEDYFSPEGKEVRDAMSLPNRLGLLFTGEPGTGKTFLAGQLAKMLREREDAVAISTTSPSSIDLGKVVDMARKDHPERLVVMIWDEFEKDYERTGRGGLNKLLAFLDGVDSRDNVVVIATCNDLSKFPSTLLDRPGRFERVAEFKLTDENVIETLLTAMVPEKYKERIDNTILLDAAKKIEKVSVDKIKSLVRDTLVNLSKGKKDYIPKDEDRAGIQKPNRPDKEESNRLMKKKISVETIRDYFWDEEKDDDDEVTPEELLSLCKN